MKAHLFALPTDVIPDNADVSQYPLEPVDIAVPFGRSVPDSAIATIVTQAHQEFAKLLKADDITSASKLIPLLSLNPEAWADMLALLPPVLAGYDEVEGFTFVPAGIGLARTTKFAVIQWYRTMYAGGTRLPFVSYKTGKKAEVVIEKPVKESFRNPDNPYHPEVIVTPTDEDEDNT